MQKQKSTPNLNLVNHIYDDEFVALINALSASIKDFFKVSRNCFGLLKNGSDSIYEQVNSSKSDISDLFLQVSPMNTNILSMSSTKFGTNNLRNSSANSREKPFKEKINSLIDKLESVKDTRSQFVKNLKVMEQNCSKFYEDAKLIFKNMKVMRNQKMEDFNNPVMQNTGSYINLNMTNLNEIVNMNKQYNSKRNESNNINTRLLSNSPTNRSQSTTNFFNPNNNFDNISRGPKQIINNMNTQQEIEEIKKMNFQLVSELSQIKQNVVDMKLENVKLRERLDKYGSHNSIGIGEGNTIILSSKNEVRTIDTAGSRSKEKTKASSVEPRLKETLNKIQKSKMLSAQNFNPMNKDNTSSRENSKPKTIIKSPSKSPPKKENMFKKVVNKATALITGRSNKVIEIDNKSERGNSQNKSVDRILTSKENTSSQEENTNLPDIVLNFISKMNNLQENIAKKSNNVPELKKEFEIRKREMIKLAEKMKMPNSRLILKSSSQKPIQLKNNKIISTPNLNNIPKPTNTRSQSIEIIRQEYQIIKNENLILISNNNWEKVNNLETISTLEGKIQISEQNNKTASKVLEDKFKEELKNSNMLKDKLAKEESIQFKLNEKIQTLDQEIINLKNTYTEGVTEFDKVQNELNSTKEDNILKVVTLKKLEEENKSLNKKLIELEDELRTIKTENETLTKKCENIEEELKKSKQIENPVIINNETTKETEIKLKDAEIKIKEVDDKLKDAEYKLKDVESKLIKAENDLQVKISEKEKEIEIILKNSKHLKEENNKNKVSYEKEMEVLKLKIKDLESTIISKETYVQNVLQEKDENYNKALNIIDVKIQELEKENNHLKELNTKIDKEFKSYKQEMIAEKMELDGKILKLELLNEQLKNSDPNNKTEDININYLKGENKDLKKNLANAENQLTEVKEELENTNENLRRVENEKKNISSLLKTKSDELIKTRIDLDTLLTKQKTNTVSDNPNYAQLEKEYFKLKSKIFISSVEHSTEMKMNSNKIEENQIITSKNEIFLQENKKLKMEILKLKSKLFISSVENNSSIKNISKLTEEFRTHTLKQNEIKNNLQKEIKKLKSALFISSIEMKSVININKSKLENSQNIYKLLAKVNEEKVTIKIENLKLKSHIFITSIEAKSLINLNNEKLEKVNNVYKQIEKLNKEKENMRKEILKLKSHIFISSIEAKSLSNLNNEKLEKSLNIFKLNEKINNEKENLKKEILKLKSKIFITSIETKSLINLNNDKIEKSQNIFKLVEKINNEKENFKKDVHQLKSKIFITSIETKSINSIHSSQLEKEKNIYKIVEKLNLEKQSLNKEILKLKAQCFTSQMEFSSIINLKKSYKEKLSSNLDRIEILTKEKDILQKENKILKSKLFISSSELNSVVKTYKTKIENLTTNEQIIKNKLQDKILLTTQLDNELSDQKKDVNISSNTLIERLEEEKSKNRKLMGEISKMEEKTVQIISNLEEGKNKMHNTLLRNEQCSKVISDLKDQIKHLEEERTFQNIKREEIINKNEEEQRVNKKEMKDLLNKISLLKQEYEVLQEGKINELGMLKSELNIYKEKIKHMEENKKNDLTDVATELNAYKEKIKEIENEKLLTVKELNILNNETEQKINNFKAENERLKEINNEYNNKIISAVREKTPHLIVDNSNQGTEEYLKTIEIFKNYNLELNKINIEFEEKLGRAVDKAKKYKELNISQHEKEKEQIVKIESLTIKLTSKEEEISKIQNEIEKLNSQNAALTTNANVEHSATIPIEKYEKLINALNNTEDKLMKSTKLVKDLNIQNDNLKKEIEQVKTKLTNIEKEREKEKSLSFIKGDNVSNFVDNDVVDEIFEQGNNSGIIIVDNSIIIEKENKIENNSIMKTVNTIQNENNVNLTERRSSANNSVRMNTKRNETMTSMKDNYKETVQKMEDNEKLFTDQLMDIKKELKETRQQRDSYKKKFDESISIQDGKKTEIIMMLKQAFEKLVYEIQITTKTKEYVNMILKILDYQDEDISRIISKKDKDKKNFLGFLNKK